MDKKTERNKYITAGILVAIVLAIVVWTFTRQW